MVQIYPSHLSFYNVSGDRINPHPFARHPGNPALDIIYFSLQLKNHPSPISAYIGSGDISHHFEPLTKVINDGLLDQFRRKREFYSSLDHIVLLILFVELRL
jgi:hypothetical protein